MMHLKAVPLKELLHFFQICRLRESRQVQDTGRVPFCQNHSPTAHRGEAVGRCQCRWDEACCSYLTVDVYAGCTIGCSYCAMKSYLNFAPLTVFSNPETGIKAIGELALKNPDRVVRAGSGEVGDSLLLDPVFGLTEDYIRGLAEYKNVFFETRTKTDFVSHLLEIKEKGNAVIGFSVNPEKIVASEEGDSASLEQRLAAAEKAAALGFKISFHVDPIFTGSDEDYIDLLQHIMAFNPIKYMDKSWNV